MFATEYCRNQFALRVYGETHSPVSVLGFTSTPIAFNTLSHLTITFKRTASISLSEWLSEKAVFSWQDRQGKRCYYHGIISHIQDAQQPGILPDVITLSSPLHALTLNQRDAVYGKSTIIDVISTLFLEQYQWKSAYHYRWLIKDPAIYTTRDYTVQYQETDWDFLQRLCRQWGLWLTVVNDESCPMILLGDDFVALTAQFPIVPLSFGVSSRHVYGNDALIDATLTRHYLPKTVTVNTYHRDAPGQHLMISESSRWSTMPSEGTLYRPREHYADKTQGQALARRHVEALDSQRAFLHAISNAAGLQVGQRITFRDHPVKLFNGDYEVGSMEYHANLNTPERTADVEENQAAGDYWVKLSLLPTGNFYRPPLPDLFYMPDVLGTIVSDNVDDQGRYLVEPKFNQRATGNGYRMALWQPYVGQEHGIHFPLRKGAEVLLTHCDGDPDRPVIAGSIANAQSPSVVTQANAYQHIVKTPAGHTLLFHEHPQHLHWKLHTPNQATVIKGNAAPGQEGMHCFTQGDMNINAQQDIRQQTDATLKETTQSDHDVRIQGTHHIDATQLHLHAKENLTINAKQNLRLHAKEGLTVSSPELQIHSKNNQHYQGSEVLLHANQGNVHMQGETINVQAKKITLSQAGASIIISDGETILNSPKQINLDCEQFVASPIQISGSAGQTESEALQNKTLLLNYVDQFHQPLSSTLAQGLIKFNAADNKTLLHATGRQSQVECHNLPVQSPYHLQHVGGVPIIAIDNKPQAPDHNITLSTPSTNVTLHCLPPAILKTIINPRQSNPQLYYQCELLSEEEIHYFKQNGNNVTVFIHGYNVPTGNYGDAHIGVENNELYIHAMDIAEAAVPLGEELSLFNIDADEKYVLTTNGVNQVMHVRTLSEALEAMQRQGDIAPDIMDYLQEHYTDHSDTYDTINGSGAHNWLLHMEYNLNCAAIGKKPFDWKTHALDYTRILGIRWTGDGGTLNFGDAQLHALKSGVALVPLIEQLQQAGLTINLIAHSLGNLVAVKMLDLCGRKGLCPFDKVILWEAAISKHALSPYIKEEAEAQLQQAKELKQQQKIANKADEENPFFTASDETEVLETPHIPDVLANHAYQLHLAAWEVNHDYVSSDNMKTTYSDPFGYFPYAHEAAKTFNVLYSDGGDGVLKKVYRAQAQLNNSWKGTDYYAAPMGEVGVEKYTFEHLGGKLHQFNQMIEDDSSESAWDEIRHAKKMKSLLTSHSAMKIPSKELFEYIYCAWIINKDAGINKFGRYKII